MKRTLTKVFVLMLTVALLTVCSPAEAAEDQTSSTVPLMVSTSDPVFSVFVPTTLPIYMDAAGNITCGDIIITNNSSGPVLVEDTQITALNGWTLADYATTTFTDTNKGQHRVALQLSHGNGLTATGSDTNEDFIPAGGRQTVSVSAKIPYQGVDATNINIAQIVFVLGWHKVISLEGLTISGENTVDVGGTIQLSATKVPANTADDGVILWSSSDTAVATVSSDGIVNGINAGTVEITASCNGKSTTHEVSVESGIPSDFNENHDILFSVTGYSTDGSVRYKKTWCAYGMDYSGNRNGCNKFDSTLHDVVSPSGTIRIQAVKWPSMLYFYGGWSFTTNEGSSCFVDSNSSSQYWTDVTLTNSQGAFTGYITFNANGGSTQP